MSYQEERPWVPDQHLTRMYLDAAYKAKITQERAIRAIKREFLDRICEALEHNPYAEFLRTEFRDETEERDPSGYPIESPAEVETYHDPGTTCRCHRT